MKRIFYLLMVLTLAVSCSKQHKVSSPDGTIQLLFRLTEAGCPEYSVQQDDKQVIDWSALGLNCAEQDLTGGFTLQGIDGNFYQDTWETVWGEESEINDTHNEMAVHLRHAGGVEMDIVFRVFNDGFAFRYTFSEQEAKQLTILDEATEYRFVADHEAWSLPWRTEYYEGIWAKAPLS